MRSAATIPSGTSAKLKEIKNPRLAQRATTNSLVSTVPITLRGCIRPEARRVGVEMGPQPPPPAASRNPATKPRGPRNALETGLSLTGLSCLRNENRARIKIPRLNKNTATIGSATSAVSIEANTTAPKKAPTAPGTASQTILDQSTLPKRQCEIPDAAQVPISAMCTLAEASAGEIPTARSSVVEVTP